jgi:DNA-binding MarR family transcriptional regulator
MATAAGTRAETRTEVEELLQQWKAVMAASRPHWGATDLTFTQLRALSVLQRGNVRVSELSEALGIGLAAASTLADRMAQRRFVVRRPDPEDGRVVHIELSSRGRTLIEHLERGRTEHFGKLIARMTPAEREALKTTLRAFVRLSADHTITKEGSHALVIVRRRA